MGGVGLVGGACEGCVWLMGSIGGVCCVFGNGKGASSGLVWVGHGGVCLLSCACSVMCCSWAASACTTFGRPTAGEDAHTHIHMHREYHFPHSGDPRPAVSNVACVWAFSSVQHVFP